MVVNSTYPSISLFEELGDAGYGGSLNDRLYTYLGDLDFTGSLPDRLAEDFRTRKIAIFLNSLPITLNNLYITLEVV